MDLICQSFSFNEYFLAEFWISVPQGSPEADFQCNLATFQSLFYQHTVSFRQKENYLCPILSLLWVNESTHGNFSLASGCYVNLTPPANTTNVTNKGLPTKVPPNRPTPMLRSKCPKQQAPSKQPKEHQQPAPSSQLTLPNQPAKQEKISEERDSYKTALQVLTKELNTAESNSPSSTHDQPDDNYVKLWKNRGPNSKTKKTKQGKGQRSDS